MIKINKKRMDAALKSPKFSIPTNLSREETRQFIIDKANESKYPKPVLKIVTKNYIVQKFSLLNEHFKSFYIAQKPMLGSLGDDLSTSEKAELLYNLYQQHNNMAVDVGFSDFS